MKTNSFIFYVDILFVVIDQLQNKQTIFISQYKYVNIYLSVGGGVWFSIISYASITYVIAYFFDFFL